MLYIFFNINVLNVIPCVLGSKAGSEVTFRKGAVMVVSIALPSLGPLSVLTKAGSLILSDTLLPWLYWPNSLLMAAWIVESGSNMVSSSSAEYGSSNPL